METLLETINSITFAEFLTVVLGVLVILIMGLELIERIGRMFGNSNVETFARDTRGNIIAVASSPLADDGAIEQYYRSQRQRVLNDDNPDNDAQYDALLDGIDRIQELLSKNTVTITPPPNELEDATSVSGENNE